MFHLLKASLAGLLLALATPTLSAQAQTDIERVSAYGAWTLEISEVVAEVVNVMDLAFEADEISNSFTEGTLTAQKASAQLDTWRTQVDAQLATLQARAERLSAGPELTPTGFEGFVASNREVPLMALDSLAEFLDKSEGFARQTIAGNSPNINEMMNARYGVLQVYYQSMITANSSIQDTLQPSHPEYYYAQSLLLNLQNTQLLMEAVRQALGDEPSRFATPDISATMRANQAAITEAVEQGRVAQTRMLTALSTLTADAMGISEAQRLTLIRVIETYTDTFDTEISGAAIHLESLDLIEADPDGGLVIDVFTEALIDYEATRDQFQIERQRMVSSF